VTEKQNIRSAGYRTGYGKSVTALHAVAVAVSHKYPLAPEHQSLLLFLTEGGKIAVSANAVKLCRSRIHQVKVTQTVTEKQNGIGRRYLARYDLPDQLAATVGVGKYKYVHLTVPF
jgi:hypothetical protein